jgi:hypothetical protein
MTALLQRVQEFYALDSATFLLIAFYCGWAAYFVKKRLENPASLVLLYPMFCVLAMTIYAGFVEFVFFSPKQHRDWIIYTVTSAAAGSGFGITFVAGLRRLQERIIHVQHRRQLARREAERLAKEPGPSAVA